MNDLIDRQMVISTLEKVFQEYHMVFRPGEEGQGFASAVPEAIMEIPSLYTGEKSREGFSQGLNTVTVRWWDGYKEDFRCTEIRFSCDLLWMRLEDGTNRNIPLRQVRWWSQSIESHQNTEM